MRTHRVVIVGGGFGGLAVAQGLKRAPVRVTLFDRRNHHLFQPLLYQVATGALSPANIASPLRGILARQRNCEVFLGNVVDFDLQQKVVVLEDGREPFDILVVAAGATHSYFGKNEWAGFAPGLKSIEDATDIRSRIYSAFEAAERSTDPEERRALLTFVIVGAGPTGVELAGALAEIARYTLRYEFRRIDPSESHVVLIEAGHDVLAAYGGVLSQRAAEAMAKRSIEVRLETKVVGIDDRCVLIESQGSTSTIEARTVLWAAGVEASPLARRLADVTKTPLDRAGRILVTPELTLRNHPDIFAIGDMTSLMQESGKPLPGLAPVAIQQGRYVARTIALRLRGRTVAPFRYRDYGSMATIGRGAAVADIKGWRFSGVFAWLTWLFIHLMYIVEYENRVLILAQWAWSYFTFDRSARLITKEMNRSRKPSPEHAPMPTSPVS